MKRIRIVVLAEDIAHGQKHLSQACPMALALRRRYPEAEAHMWGWCPSPTLHGGLVIHGASGATSGRYQISERAHQFIVDVDAGEPVKPSTFYVERPPYPRPA
jgi:hypothetical protein